jgi:hypothetical protein
MNDDNDDPISKLSSPAGCEQFAKNVEARNPDLAKAARVRAIRMLAGAMGAKTDAERESLEAVFAYEHTLFKKHGRAIKASYTWRMIRERGIIPAVEHVVVQGKETIGYVALVEAGMQEMAFEAVVLRHPAAFSELAVTKSRERLEAWQVG